MKITSESKITPQANNSAQTGEVKTYQALNQKSLASGMATAGGKQIAQHNLGTMQLQAGIARTDLQKQFEENTVVKNKKLDQAAGTGFIQDVQQDLANQQTQKKPFDLVQNGTQGNNNSIRPGINANAQLPGLDRYSQDDQNLKSTFQDFMSGRSATQQGDSSLIDGAKTPNHNLGEGNLLGGTDSPGFKDPTDLSNYPRQSQDSDFIDDATKAASEVWESAKKTVKDVLEHAAEKIIGPVRNNNEKDQLEELEKEDLKKRPADDAANERPQGAVSAPAQTQYSKLVDNEFTTFDASGVDKYLRLAKGMTNSKINPDPDAAEGIQGGTIPSEPVPGAGVVDPPDRPFQPTKGPIPVTGPIRKSPGGLPR
jgi:hypothetical protein